MTRVPIADPREEAVSVLGAGTDRGVVLRAVGGLAVRLACPSASRPPLERPTKDIDLVGLGSQRADIERLLAELGYSADESFNLLSANGQLYFRDLANGRQVDVFLDRMSMCHTLELADRLQFADLTVTPTDLLLSKLQVYETNERDLKDAAALLLDCSIDDDYIASLLSRDWGWWRTVTEVLDRLEAYVDGLELQLRSTLQARIDALRSRIHAEPKSRRWKLRARVGDRMAWYQLPEDDHAAEAWEPDSRLRPPQA
jgi:hypothetical protein